mgnify:CR=1 FL=1
MFQNETRSSKSRSTPSVTATPSESAGFTQLSLTSQPPDPVPELPSESVAAATPVVLSVSDLNAHVKKTLESEYALVWVRGELSNFKSHGNGHFYFSLKDAASQISAVMFRGFNSRLKFKPHDGLEVLVRGRISVYEPRGTYQIICESMEPVGAGALQKAFEQLKEKLRLEGLFAPERKRALPALPLHVAVVTSPTGAAIRDILNILKRRAPFLNVTVVPAVVQGEAAAPGIAKALRTAWALPKVDVIIVGRGGGSIEDMWCFNDENLARTIVASPVPVISAVGHEIDFTICDFVADLRAPTPSAAAELVCTSSQDLVLRLKQNLNLLHRSTQRWLQLRQRQWQLVTKGLQDPRRRLQDLLLRNDDLRDRLQRALTVRLDRCRHQTQTLRQRIVDPRRTIELKTQFVKAAHAAIRSLMTSHLERAQLRCTSTVGLLNSLSPLQVVARGYSIVTDPNGRVLTRARDIQLGQDIQVKLASGEIIATVKDTQLNTKEPNHVGF